MTEEKFLEYNPQYLRWALPTTPDKHQIHVPNGEVFLKRVKKIAIVDKTPHQKHKVQKGENLGIIAKKYGTTVNSIQTVNKIKNPNSIRVGTTLIIPTTKVPEKTTSKRNPPQKNHLQKQIVPKVILLRKVTISVG